MRERRSTNGLDASDPSCASSASHLSTVSDWRDISYSTKLVRFTSNFYSRPEDFTSWRGISAEHNVWLVKCRISGGVLALRVWNRATADTKKQILLMRSVLAVLHKSTKLVPQVLDVFEDKGDVFVCFEYMPRGSLGDAVHCSAGGVDDEGWLASQVVLPVALALHRMHEMALVHRKVTPESILFAANGSVRLSGFEQVCDTSACEPSALATRLPYAAPEILLCESHNAGDDASTMPASALTYGEKVDVWSLGVTVYFALTGKLPFAASDDERLCHQILFDTPEYPRHLSGEATQFLKDCLQKYGSDRPQMCDLLTHAWIRKHLGWRRREGVPTPEGLYSLHNVKMPWERRTPAKSGFSLSPVLARNRHAGVPRQVRNMDAALIAAGKPQSGEAQQPAAARFERSSTLPRSNTANFRMSTDMRDRADVTYRNELETAMRARSNAQDEFTRDEDDFNEVSTPGEDGAPIEPHCDFLSRLELPEMSCNGGFTFDDTVPRQQSAVPSISAWIEDHVQQTQAPNVGSKESAAASASHASEQARTGTTLTVHINPLSALTEVGLSSASVGLLTTPWDAVEEA